MDGDILQGVIPTTGWGLLLYLVLAVVLPSLVALVTKRLADGNVKALVLIALSVVASLVAELVSAASTGDDFDLKTALARAATLFYLAVGAHFGLLRNKVTGVNGALSNLAPDTGLGTPQLSAVVHADVPAKGASTVEFTTDGDPANTISEGIKPDTADNPPGTTY